MAHTAVNLLEIGDIIRTEDGSGDLLYVQDFIRNASNEITDLIVFPIIGDDDHIDEDMVGFIHIETGSIQDKLQNEQYPKKISVSLAACARFNKFNPNFLVQKIGSAHRNVINEINTSFAQLGGNRNLKLSSLSDHDSEKIKGMDWSRYTGGSVIGSIYLDGQENFLSDVAPRQAEKGKKRRAKANTIVTTPDMYLEDACVEGLISKRLYKFFRYTNEKTGIITLTEAFGAIAKFDTLKQKTEDMLGFVEKYRANLEQDDIEKKTIDQDTTIQSAHKITIQDAHEVGIISSKHLLHLPLQEQENGIQCKTLGEAIELIIFSPDALEKFGIKFTKTGEKTKRKFTPENLEKMKNSLIDAYDILEEIENNNSYITKDMISDEINDALNSVRKTYAGLEVENPIPRTKIFNRPNIRFSGNEKINAEIQAQLEKIRQNLPPKLDL